MKYLVLIIGLTMISCESEANRVEDKLYNCLMSSLSEKEREKVKPIIIGFEQHLIKKGILESSAAESYWNLYKKIADTGTYDFKNDFGFLEKINFLNREKPDENNGLIDCHTKIFQSEAYLKSRQYKLKQEIQSLRKPRATPKIIAKTTIAFLKVEDFELDYNKLMTLMFIEDLNSKLK